MSVVDWFVLFVMVVTLVEIVVELRRKEWLRAGVAAVFLAFIAYMWRPMFWYIWRKLTGGGP